jgi:uncharacterized protein YjfI (DUF2170 family)
MSTILQQLLEKTQQATNLTFTAEMLGDDVMKVTAEDLEDFPILVTANEHQIDALINLVPLTEIPSDDAVQLSFYKSIVAMNNELDLSVVGVESGYCNISGQLSADSKFESFVKEIELLTENTVEAIEFISEFVADQ